jgi:aryl-alcohol dehydrogenase-like predicted oxidoreductase
MGNLAKEGTILDNIAVKYHASPSQISLAWLLKRSPAMIPIPGTSKVSHLEENMKADEIVLSKDDFNIIDQMALKTKQ